MLPEFKKGELVATRKAYGLALVALGKQLDTVVSLDAEVKNSTFAELFEKAFPDRFVQCFIAEQNMVSMGVGFASRAKIPFISTFACFFTRAYDQIRMAAIGQAPLRLVGSHVGVSIGEDGPSQMGLEDIAMMRAIPHAVVLYPADAVATFALVGHMANRNDGISYMRTTRAATPIIYDNNTQFPIGGCQVIRHSKDDKVCIIAAGITLFEALKAYDVIAQEKISVSVIDAYSIQPLPGHEIARVVKKSGNRVITVEDHYPAGGLGEAVAMALINEGVTLRRLAVNHMPRSGTPEELLAYEEINAEAIVKAIKELI
jgi:transketolase